MKIRVTPPDSALENAFSLIADFEGDMNNILHTPFDPVLPALALRNMMLFPGVVGSVTIGREYSLRVVKQAVKKNSIIALFSQRDEQVEMPAAADLYPQGVAARIMRTIDLPSGHMAAIIQCYGPLQLKSLRKTSGGFRAEVEPLEEQLCAPDDTEFLTVTDACRTSVLKYLKYNEQVGGEKAAMAVRNISHPVFFINFLCSNLPISPDERYGLFEKHEMMARAYDLLRLLNRECQYAQIKADIEARTREDLDQQQRDYFMQQQIRKMQDELGEGEDTEIENLSARAVEAQLPPKVMKAFEREMQRLRHVPSLEQCDRRQPRHQACRGPAQPRPLRHGAREGTHTGISGQPALPRQQEGTHTLPLRSAGSGQDVARAQHCRSPRPQIRAHFAGRHTR